MKKKTTWAKSVKTTFRKHPKLIIGILIFIILFGIQSCSTNKINEEKFKTAYARGNELGAIAEKDYAEAESYFNSAKVSGKYAEVVEQCGKAKDLYSDSEMRFINAQESYLKAEEFGTSRTLRKIATLAAEESAILANISIKRYETCESLELTAYAAEVYRSDRNSRNLYGVKYYEDATKEQLKDWDVLIAEFNKVRLEVTTYKSKIN